MKSKIVYAVIVLLALVHLAVVVPAIQHPERFRVVDSDQYVDLATNLLHGHYSGSLYPRDDLIRPPVYPLFLALVILIFSDPKWVSLVHVLIVLVNCLILYRIGLDLKHRNVGLAAIVIYLLSINVLFDSLNVMTETLASLLLMLAIWLLLKFWLTQKSQWLVLSGLCMGAGALNRPIVYPLFIVWGFLLLLIWTWERKKLVFKKQYFLNVLVFLSAGLFIVVGWQVRNFVVYQRFTLSSVGEMTVKDYMIGRSVAYVYQIPLDDARQMIQSAPDQNAFIVRFVLDHPGAFLATQARGILLTSLAISYPTWGNMMTGASVPATGIIADMSFDISRIFDQVKAGNAWILVGVAALIDDLVLFSMIGIGLWRTFAPRRRDLVVLTTLIVLVTAAYMIIVPFAQGNGRFRTPVEPYLAWMAALAFLKRE
jgi:4-amino-4-deoxy-L-arabinose transferase-like glycosyltransferase